MKRKWWFFLLGLGLAGCAGHAVLEDFDTTTKLHAKLMRWNKYQQTLQFIPAASTEHQAAKLQRLQDIRITSYAVKKRRISADKKSVYQEVEVRYYNINFAVEKTLLDRQMWSYDDAVGKWLLQSGVPEFR